MDKIEAFFHSISSQLLEFVPTQLQNIQIERQKDSSDTNFATQVDTLTESIIVLQIKEKFPGDLVIAEEGSSSQLFTEKGRYWIIDPICGTSNMSRGIPMFCTNIALAENGQLIAAMVIDYARRKYVWSIGQSRIFCKRNLLVKKSKTSGLVVDVNLSAYGKGKEIGVHLENVRKLLVTGKFFPVSFATSLGFLYVVTGRVDAILSPAIHLWDPAAAVFLIEQTGGVVTQINGDSWSVKNPSQTLLAAKTKELHTQILDLITN